MSQFINSEPRLNESGKMAWCFIGYNTKASTDEERALADSNGYVKVSGKLVAFGENKDVLLALSKGAKVDLVTEPGALKKYIDREGNPQEYIESVFVGFKGGATSATAQAQKQLATKVQPKQEDLDAIFASEEEIPF